MRKMQEGFSIRNEYLDKLIKSKLADINNGITNSDLTSILLRAKKVDGTAAFEAKEIRAHLYTFLFAAFV